VFVCFCSQSEKDLLVFVLSTLFVLCDLDFYSIVIMKIVGLWRCIPAEVFVHAVGNILLGRSTLGYYISVT